MSAARWARKRWIETRKEERKKERRSCECSTSSSRIYVFRNDAIEGCVCILLALCEEATSDRSRAKVHFREAIMGSEFFRNSSD